MTPANLRVGYSVITYLLQIKDRHNGNILLDRDGHLVHIDFGFMLANSPGNMGFEAAPFKLPLEYVDVLGGLGGAPFAEFRRLFREGFEAARKHCDRIVTVVELMQHDSTLPCFAAFGEQTAQLLRDRFQQKLTQSLVEEHVERLIDTSLGSHWTRLYDSVGVLLLLVRFGIWRADARCSISITRNPYYSSQSSHFLSICSIAYSRASYHNSHRNTKLTSVHGPPVSHWLEHQRASRQEPCATPL